MGFRFHKMEGTANDFVVVHRSDLPPGAGPMLARAVCDRRRGIGADGILVVEPAGDATVGGMTVWNADGSVAEMCGNGLRCVVVRLAEDGLWPGGSAALSTGAGPVRAELTERGVRVALGVPRAASDTRSIDTPHGAVVGLDVDLGNPHFVVFAEDAPDADLRTWGPFLGRHPAFPNGTNVERIEVEGDHLRMRVWERGSGETAACGSGACASVVAARRLGRLEALEADVLLPGGTLRVGWDGHGAVTLEGPARTVFSGLWPHGGA